jgi:hypothetical protein
MSITVVPSAITGQTLSAAQWNTQVRDNINGIWVLTTAGDMLYATGSAAAARLAAGAAYKTLRMNSAGNAPEWQGFIGGKAIRTSNQSIATSPSSSNIQFTSASISRLATWDTGDNTKLTIGVSGVFIVGVTMTYDGGSGYREMNVLKNAGAAILESRYPTASGETTYTTVSDLLALAAGDYLQLQTKHNQGSTINVRAASLWVSFQGIDA